MKAIDLTHIITEDMPVYPGTEPPKLTPANSYEKDGFKETLLSLYTHTGTHIDPPAHIFPDGRTLDEFPPEQFIGKALVIEDVYKRQGQHRLKLALAGLAVGVHAVEYYALANHVKVCLRVGEYGRRVAGVAHLRAQPLSLIHIYNRILKGHTAALADQLSRRAQESVDRYVEQLGQQL